MEIFKDGNMEPLPIKVLPFLLGLVPKLDGVVRTMVVTAETGKTVVMV